MADIREILVAPGQGHNEVVEGMEREDYDHVVGMNPSTLVAGTDSMRHLFHLWNNPRPDKPAYVWGRAAHTLYFEPAYFGTRYTIWHERRQGNAWKSFAGEAAAKGMEVLKPDEYQGVLDASQSFLANEEVMALVKSGKPEVTLLCVEEDLQCRGRVDWIGSDEIMVDLKTTRNINRRAVSRDFYKYHYDIKLACYRRWFRLLTRRQLRVVVVWLENKPPYACRTMEIPEAVMDRGEVKALELLDAVRECLATGIWPDSDPEGDFYLETPSWEMEDLIGVEDEEYESEEYREAA